MAIKGMQQKLAQFPDDLVLFLFLFINSATSFFASQRETEHFTNAPELSINYNTSEILPILLWTLSREVVPFQMHGLTLGGEAKS